MAAKMNVFEMQAEAPSGRKPGPWYGLTALAVALIDLIFAYLCFHFTVMLSVFVWNLDQERHGVNQFLRNHDLVNFFNGKSLFYLTFWIGILLQAAITIANTGAAEVLEEAEEGIRSKVYPTVSLWETSKFTNVFMWFYQVFILSCDVIEITVFVLFFNDLWGVEAFMPVALHFILILCRFVAFIPFNMVVSNSQPFLPQPL